MQIKAKKEQEKHRGGFLLKPANARRMTYSVTRLVTIIYISLNATITLIVSILGVKYVRDEIKKRKNQLTMKSISEKGSETGQADTVVETKQEPNPEAPITSIQKDDANLEDNMKKLSKMKIIRLWLKLVWKMRGCYMSLIVHLFDVLTDILVIIEWWNLEEKYGDKESVDSRLMASWGIFVLLLHKLVSSLAFWIKDKNIYRSMLQFFDILIFEEIYVAHKKIVSKFQGHDDSEKATETTTSFKYIRSLEAVWESIPQSVLQMVFLIRTGGDFGEDNVLMVISILSIFQSIVSMTNSILKQDNLFMDSPKFKKHRKRLPPTFPFFKHALCRFSEVFSRIALLSLFWAVCGGEMFSGLLGVELLFIIALTLFERFHWSADLQDLNVDEMFLRVQCVVVLPTEMVFAELGKSGIVNCQLDTQYSILTKSTDGRGWKGYAVGCCTTMFCCFIPAALLTTCCCLYGRERHYLHPRIRIGVSLMEWTVLIVVGLLVEDGLLFSAPLYLTIFILGMALHVVNSQYLYLLPDFALPHGVGIRTKWGYAFNGELEELKRMKDQDWDQKVGQNDEKFKNAKDEWEIEKYRGKEGTQPIMFALANGHFNIVEFLETEKGAVKHKELMEQCKAYCDGFEETYQKLKAQETESDKPWGVKHRWEDDARQKGCDVIRGFIGKMSVWRRTNSEFYEAMMQRFGKNDSQSIARIFIDPNRDLYQS